MSAAEEHHTHIICLALYALLYDENTTMQILPVAKGRNLPNDLALCRIIVQRCPGFGSCKNQKAFSWIDLVVPDWLQSKCSGKCCVSVEVSVLGPFSVTSLFGLIYIRLFRVVSLIEPMSSLT